MMLASNVSLLLKVAAGTLDASTKIYAVRVDAVHADAYRVLGGLGAETKPGEGESLISLFTSVCAVGYSCKSTELHWS